MTAAEQIVFELVEAWNSKDVDRICTFFHDDFENDQAPLPVVRGLAAYREHLQRWFDAYPDLRLKIVTLFSDGDLVCLETRATGSPRTAFYGVDAPRRSVNRALDILELRNGKVWRQRGYWDFSLWTGHVSPLVDRSAHMHDPGRAAS